MTQLNGLLHSLDPLAPPAQRHLWLINLLAWVRGSRDSPPLAAAARIRLLLDALAARPDLEQRLRQWWGVLAETVDATPLLADFGFASRMAFLSELGARLRLKVLPTTPETADSAELFALAMPRASDAGWIAALDGDLLARLAQLLSIPSPVPGLPLWQHEVLEAINYCAIQISAAGFSAQLRQRMNLPAHDARPFHAVALDAQNFRAAYIETPREAVKVEAAATRLRERLEACRQAAASVYPHLNEHGISVGLVFMLRQLRERILRACELMDCLLSADSPRSAARLVSPPVP